MKKLDIDKELDYNLKIQINSFHFLKNLRYFEKMDIENELDKNVKITGIINNCLDKRKISKK
jgi:hypothetical protein